MSSQNSNQNISTSSKGTIHPRQRMPQNFLLIWVDASIDESKQDCQNTVAQLRSVVSDVNTFTQRDEAIDFLTDLHDMNVFLIAEDTISQHIVPLIHDISQLDGIYILSGNESLHAHCTKEWAKIKGVHTDINPIREALQLAVMQCNQDSIAVSFVTVDEATCSQNLNQLEPSFMYTRIFKEILLEMKHDDKSIKDFITFWRQHYINNAFTLKVIAEFERDYCPRSCIRWYTREYFIYQMLNRALRTLEGDTIITMGFFIRDLHEQIVQLYQEQLSTYHGKSITVYRGQGLLKTDFEKLVKSQGGLMSFNNFLSTSREREVSLVFAECASTNTDMVGVLFKMNIDPAVSSAPFASIREVSYFQTEEEILFSMHTVFRVGEITKIDNSNSLYQVDIKLTADDDQELRTLTERIQEEIEDETGWQRLGVLLIKLNQFDKAEELYNVLLEQTSDTDEKAQYYNNIGYIKKSQGDYEKAIEYYEKTLEIDQKTLSPNYRSLATSYNNIGSVYKDMGEYLKALSFYEKALEICQKTLSPDYHSLAPSYNNIGLVYDIMGEYSKALSFYEKTREICQKTLPPNHPHLAISYTNMGEVYNNMGEYSKALSFHEKSLEIFEKTLPPNHPDLATSYNNIATLYMNMGEYSKALLFHEKGLKISEKALPSNNPDLATSYNNIGAMYMGMEEYSKALSFYEKSLEIYQKTLPENHPDMATSYNNIGMVYNNMGEYPKALSFSEKAAEIFEKTLPPNHPTLATSYNSLGGMYHKMGEYSKALSFSEKAVDIFENTLPPYHPWLALSYYNIGAVYKNMGEYSKALSLYEKSLEIRQKALSPDHPDLALSYNNIALVYYNMGEYSKALLNFELAQNIWQCSLPSIHPNIKAVQANIKYVKTKL